MGQASAMVLVLVDTVLALLQVDNTAVNVGPSRSLVHHLGQLRGEREFPFPVIPKNGGL